MLLWVNKYPQVAPHLQYLLGNSSVNYISPLTCNHGCTGFQPWNKSVITSYHYQDVYYNIPHCWILLSPPLTPLGSWYHNNVVSRGA